MTRGKPPAVQSPDFRVIDCGTCWRIRPVSKAAKDIIYGMVAEPWQRFGGDLVTDWRPAADLCHQLREDGYQLIATSVTAQHLIETGRPW